ncbi:MAG: ABC transporter permease [Nitrospirae bacterium]|nr:ABC transporter permease [Nitrospirota bacterium]
MNRLRYFLQEAMGNIRLNRTTTVLAIGTTAFTLACFGVFLLLYLNLRTMVGSLQDELKAMVYLQDMLPAQGVMEVERHLRADREVASLTYVSKEKALTEFMRAFPSEHDLLKGLGDNPLPASFEVTLAPEYRSSDAVMRWAERTRLTPGVAQVQYSRDWIDNLARLLFFLEVVALAVGTILAAASITIIANTIRLTLLARQEEREIMRLIGATQTFVKAPYVLEGALFGLVGAALSLALLKGGFEFMKMRLDQPGQALGFEMAMSFFPTKVSLMLVLAGLLVGCTGSLLSLIGFEKGKL